MKFFKHRKKIMLPRTEEQYDALVKTLMHEFDLPNEEHAATIVANRIMHLPPDQATTTLRYLGHCVLKNIAFQIAQNKGQRIQHKTQVDDLVTYLKANPNDQQARDALEKGANEGSDYAKQALEKLGLVDHKVLNLVQPISSGEDTAAPAVSSDPA